MRRHSLLLLILRILRGLSSLWHHNSQGIRYLGSCRTFSIHDSLLRFFDVQIVLQNKAVATYYKYNCICAAESNKTLEMARQMKVGLCANECMRFPASGLRD